ncbi:MAG: AAA family ATPase [Bacteroidales bacterium]
MSFSIDTDNEEFQDALNLIQYTRQSVFLTGKAGTGKSTFLKYICQNTKKKFVVLAPTGVAAINAGGSTIHSFFKLPFRPLMPDDPDLSTLNNRIFEFFKYNREHRKVIESVELIIIDEISMVRADMIDTIDRILRIYSKNTREPFGGKQVLFVGDIFQLEPVVTSDARDILSRFYRSPFFFSAKVFADIQLVPIELRKVYRQKDPSFIKVLDNVRSNIVDNHDLMALNQRVDPRFNPSDSDFYITLATRRDTVDQINEEKLRSLKGDSMLFRGSITGEFPSSSLPTQVDLELKEQAQVIFIKNDIGPHSQRRWANGTIGKITGFTPENEIVVMLENGKEYKIEREMWRNVKYSFNEKEHKIEEEELGTFTQYPIRLAWAITIHKSQGLTFSHTIIDLSGGAFTGGQTYVALSRCTSLEGIVLRREISRRDIFIHPDVTQFSHQFNNRLLIDKALKQAQADILYKESIKSFDKGSFQDFLDNFFKAIHSRYDIEKPLIKRYIRKKLNLINQLKQEIKDLKAQREEDRAWLSELAHEFYLMGNECVVKAHNSQAAIANFDKALRLDPKHVDAWIRKGVTLHDMKEYYDAEICFNRAVELSPVLFKAYYNRGKNRIAMGAHELAISDLDKAINLNKEHVGAIELLADCYYHNGNSDTAEHLYQIAEHLRKNKKSKK